MLNNFKFNPETVNLNDFFVPYWSIKNKKIITNSTVQRPTYDFRKENKINYLCDDPSVYYLNNYGFRCDDFTSKHDGKHLLFAGCSNTFGVGLPQNFIWAKQVYDQIKLNEKVSGFYNLGIPAGSYFEIISNIFKYIKNFGNPDYIFINFPDVYRDIIYIEKNGNQTEETSYLSVILTHNIYNMLEQYCLSNDIKLISFSWIQSMFDRYDLIKNKHWLSLYKNKTGNQFYNSFKTFYKINEKEFFNDVVYCFEKNKNLEIIIDAYDRRDDQDAHFGYAFHYAWANFAYKTYAPSAGFEPATNGLEVRDSIP